MLEPPLIRGSTRFLAAVGLGCRSCRFSLLLTAATLAAAAFVWMASPQTAQAAVTELPSVTLTAGQGGLPRFRGFEAAASPSYGTPSSRTVTHDGADYKIEKLFITPFTDERYFQAGSSIPSASQDAPALTVGSEIIVVGSAEESGKTSAVHSWSGAALVCSVGDAVSVWP